MDNFTQNFCQFERGVLYFCHYFTQNGRKSSIFTLFTNINLSTCIAHRLAHVQKRPCRWLGGSRLECPRPEMLLLGEILKFLSLRPRAADRPWLLTAAGPWPWQRRAQGEEAARGRAQQAQGQLDSVSWAAPGTPPHGWGTRHWGSGTVSVITVITVIVSFVITFWNDKIVSLQTHDNIL